MTGGGDSEEADKAFTGAIPALYDRYLGPLLFQPYATDLAERVRVLAPGRILEIAAGTGIATRALIATLPPTGSITATDLNPPMLDHAATLTPAGRVTWRQADAMALPFADHAFDAVICQFGAMFFPDKETAFREARRVLAGDGAYIFSVWDRIEANEVAELVSNALAALFPGDPPAFLKRGPHSYHDELRIREDLSRAGFTRIDVDTVPLRGRAASVVDVATGFCLGSPLRGEIETRNTIPLDQAVRLIAQALAVRFGNGPIDAKLQALVFTAVR
jgi:SAM-dependent methyltransferase